MSYIADECYDVYAEKAVRARKPHICSACGRSIDPGHRYIRVLWIYDGYRNGCKRCGACQTLHMHLRKLGDGGTWPDEKLGCGRTYEGEWDRLPPPEIDRLPFLSGDEASALLDEHPSLSRDSYDIRGNGSGDVL